MVKYILILYPNSVLTDADDITEAESFMYKRGDVFIRTDPFNITSAEGLRDRLKKIPQLPEGEWEIRERNGEYGNL